MTTFTWNLLSKIPSLALWEREMVTTVYILEVFLIGTNTPWELSNEIQPHLLFCDLN
jgi:hypothetical protein